MGGEKYFPPDLGGEKEKGGGGERSGSLSLPVAAIRFLSSPVSYMEPVQKKQKRSDGDDHTRLLGVYNPHGEDVIVPSGVFYSVRFSQSSRSRKNYLILRVDFWEAVNAWDSQVRSVELPFCANSVQHVKDTRPVPRMVEKERSEKGVLAKIWLSIPGEQVSVLSLVPPPCRGASTYDAFHEGKSTTPAFARDDSEYMLLLSWQLQIYEPDVVLGSIVVAAVERPQDLRIRKTHGLESTVGSKLVLSAVFGKSIFMCFENTVKATVFTSEPACVVVFDLPDTQAFATNTGNKRKFLIEETKFPYPCGKNELGEIPWSSMLVLKTTDGSLKVAAFLPLSFPASIWREVAVEKGCRPLPDTDQGKVMIAHEAGQQVISAKNRLVETHAKYDPRWRELWQPEKKEVWKVLADIPFAGGEFLSEVLSILWRSGVKPWDFPPPKPQLLHAIDLFLQERKRSMARTFESGYRSVKEPMNRVWMRQSSQKFCVKYMDKVLTLFLAEDCDTSWMRDDLDPLDWRRASNLTLDHKLLRGMDSFFCSPRIVHDELVRLLRVNNRALHIFDEKSTMNCLESPELGDILDIPEDLTHAKGLRIGFAVPGGSLYRDYTVAAIAVQVHSKSNTCKILDTFCIEFLLGCTSLQLLQRLVIETLDKEQKDVKFVYKRGEQVLLHMEPRKLHRVADIRSMLLRA